MRHPFIKNAKDIEKLYWVRCFLKNSGGIYQREVSDKAEGIALAQHEMNHQKLSRAELIDAKSKTTIECFWPPRDP